MFFTFSQSKSKQKLGHIFSSLGIGLMMGLLSSPALAGGEWRGGHDLYGDYEGISYSDDPIVGDDESYEIWAALGLMQGESHLQLFDVTTGALAGEANWDFDSIIMLGIGLDMGLTDWLSIGVSGWFAVDGDSDLSTFSYADPASSAWTDSENFSGTEIDDASRININAALHLYRDQGLILSALIGYRYEDIEASNRGGSFVFSSAPPAGFRDITGTYANGRIGYTLDQSFSLPYFGLEAGYDRGSFAFKGRVIGSIWGEYDVRVTEGTNISSVNVNTNDVNVIGVSLEGKYRFTDRLSLLAGFDYIHYDEERNGTLTTTGILPGGIQTDSASFEHENYTFSIGLSYLF